MPITYEIERPANLTTFTLSGEISFQDFLNTLNRYGEAGPTLFEIYDARPLAGRRLSAEEMDMLADYLSRYFNVRPLGSKTAIVVSGDLDFGLSRMLETLTEGKTVYNIQAFRDMDDAKAWLESSDAS
jgi:hypothetical protein